MAGVMDLMMEANALSDLMDPVNQHDMLHKLRLYVKDIGAEDDGLTALLRDLEVNKINEFVLCDLAETLFKHSEFTRRHSAQLHKFMTTLHEEYKLYKITRNEPRKHKNHYHHDDSVIEFNRFLKNYLTVAGTIVTVRCLISYAKKSNISSRLISFFWGV
jgi:G:T-mismatch repair DNA endonuclease (very short patch repair protein)